jgi:hypothetical protein
MQLKSETIGPDTVMTIRLNSAKEMYDFNQVTHEHTEYTTEWSKFLYSLYEYKGISSNVYITIFSDKEQPGDIIARITIYCKDNNKLDYIEAEITKKISNVLSITN